MSNLPFHEPIHSDLERVESLLRKDPPGQHRTVSSIVEQLVAAGGKRLRPTAVLLSARLCGADMKRAIIAAAAVEMLHTATLVHDDLIDGSPVRRGLETLNSHQPPGVAVLAGDYIFARAAHLAAQTESVRWVRRFSETLMAICSGEVQQLFDEQNGETSRQEYDQRIYAKTASLVALSAEAGAILAEAGEGVTGALRTYGERLGLAFQIVDDVLDYVGSEEVLGKSVGSDLQHGVITLPLLLFLELEPDHPTVLQALQPNASEDPIQEAVQAVASSAAIEQALEIARLHADRAKKALQVLPDSLYRKALIDLADFAVDRPF